MSSTDFSSINPNDISVYTTFFVQVDGAPVGGDVFACGTYQVHVEKTQILADTAGAAVDLLRDSLHITHPDSLYTRVFDTAGNEIKTYCSNDVSGIFGHIARCTETPSFLNETRKQSCMIDQIFAGMTGSVVD